MKETGLMFKAPLVRAILAGQKTQTRRVVKFRPGFDLEEREDGSLWPWMEHPDRCDDVWMPCSLGQPGDRIYVRETFGHFERNENFKPGCECFYRADGDSVELQPWRPAIHMPKHAARIWLEVTGVRVERLQQITEEDAKAEGAPMKNSPAAHLTSYRRGFQELWESTGGDWAMNPWVWVIDFKTISTTGLPA